jgi:autoinducer 2 (AI-2) kinase
MAAGVGAGAYKNLSHATGELVVWDKTYEPHASNKKLYDEIKIKWQKAYEVQLKLVDEGVTESMWKAPGL